MPRLPGAGARRRPGALAEDARLVLGAVLLLLLAGCQPDAAACCRTDGDCAAGARCFEGLCAPRCSYDGQCGAGQLCAPGGVCVALGRPKGHCAFAFGEGNKPPPADAGTADAGPGEDAGPETCEDRYEPNDSAASATTGFAPVERLGICSGDHDYFALAAGLGDTIAARIEFPHAEGDLDMELLLRGEQVAVSQGVSDAETIELEAAGAGTYVLHVFGFGATVENRYELAFTRVPVGGTCDDPNEPNDEPGAATNTSLPAVVDGVACPNDLDLFRLHFEPGRPTYDLLLWSEGGAWAAVIRENDFGTLVELEHGVPVSLDVSNEASGELLLLVAGDSLSTLPYIVEMH